MQYNQFDSKDMKLTSCQLNNSGIQDRNTIHPMKNLTKKTDKIFSSVVLGMGILSVLLLASCGGKSKTEDKQEVKRVRVETLKQMDINQQVVYAGTVEPFEQAFISSSTPVRINKIYKEVGDEVRKGDLLVQMDASNFRQAKTQLENLEKEHSRLDTLYKIGSISQQQLDQMTTQLEVARTSFENLNENTQLRSPINGVVTGRYFENGEMFSMSPTAAGRAAILTVMDINPVKVIINVPGDYFVMVNKDIKVSLELDVYKDQTFDGSLHIKYPTIDPATRTFSVELKFPNPDLALRPGMFGRVTMVLGDAERVMVPDRAVMRQTGVNERFVFVVENNKAVRKPIETGRLVGNNLEVLKGLSAGEKVVVAGTAGLLEGMDVEVVQ